VLGASDLRTSGRPRDGTGRYARPGSAGCRASLPIRTDNPARSRSARRTAPAHHRDEGTGRIPDRALHRGHCAVTRVAITGHRGLPAATERLVDAALRAEIARYESGLIGLSALADGADALFARAVLDAGGDLVVIVPAKKYRDGLAARTLRHLRRPAVAGRQGDRAGFRRIGQPRAHGRQPAHARRDRPSHRGVGRQTGARLRRHCRRGSRRP